MIKLKQYLFTAVFLFMLTSNKGYSAEAVLNKLLITAVYLGQVDKVQELLDQGADARFKNVAGETPLIIAAAHGDTTIVSILVSHDLATKNDTDNEGHADLWHARTAKDERMNQLDMPKLEQRQNDYSLIIDTLS